MTSNDFDPDEPGGPGVAAVPDDVQAIKNIIHSYAEMLDSGDLDGLGSLFERATLRTHGADHELRGAAEVRRLIEDAVHLYDGVLSTKHLVTNVIVEVHEGRTSANARSYYAALQARPELPLQPILTGRWDDRFEREGARWYIVDRLIYVDLVGDVRYHLKGLA
jgi:SnoaL-like domain